MDKGVNLLEETNINEVHSSLLLPRPWDYISKRMGLNASYHNKGASGRNEDKFIRRGLPKLYKHYLGHISKRCGIKRTPSQ